MKPSTYAGPVEALRADESISRTLLSFHDVDIDEGMSGSPLVNSDGEVIGVITDQYRPKSFAPNQSDFSGVRHGLAVGMDDVLVGISHFSLQAPRGEIGERVLSQLEPLGAGFVGRDGFAEQLADRSGLGVVCQVVEGGGGVGKSELALWWAHQAVRSNVEIVWWVDASDEVTAHAGLIELAARLGVVAGDRYSDTAQRLAD